MGFSRNDFRRWVLGMQPCEICRAYRQQLETLRQYLYKVLDQNQGEQGHPDVLLAASHFDRVLNAYHAHLKTHAHTTLSRNPSLGK